MSKKKILKRDCIDNIIYDIEGSLDKTIEYLQKLKEDYSKNYIDLFLEIHCFDDYGNPRCNINLIGSREETKEEKSNRLLKEKQILESQKQHELKLLESLKKKYE